MVGGGYRGQFSVQYLSPRFVRLSRLYKYFRSHLRPVKSLKVQLIATLKNLRSDSRNPVTINHKYPAMPTRQGHTQGFMDTELAELRVSRTMIALLIERGRWP